MKNSVKIAKHPISGEIVTQNPNKPEFGTIRVDSESISMENGFLNKSKRSAFIHGNLKDLQSLGYTEGQAIEGKIVRTESFEPQYEGHAPKINPTTKQVVLVNGKKVYFKDSFTADLSQADLLIKGSTVVAPVSVNTLD